MASKEALKLIEPPYVDSIEWSKWSIFFLDDRVVPLDHPDSSYKLTYDGFLSKVGEIIGRFEKKGFSLKGLKFLTVEQAFAEKHYADLSSKPFFNGLERRSVI
ncbi:hypothetical protein L6452_33329 [Arctium lappa]|uniref:Uncharacterized protein n=1 Tax=Arctium lappa TaxID=4217 RepID=A0ACB8YF44_ARCLA|nr:hypothetical protein L6452_33329 [Arctium lappa]